MFRKTNIDPVFSNIHLFHGLLMSLVAGSVNVGGFLASGRFVTHVTGFATLVGASGAQGRWGEAAGLLSVPVFFLGGAMLSAYLVDRRRNGGREPLAVQAFALASTCILAAAVLGQLHLISRFGETLDLKRDYLFMALLCLSGGIMNGLISSASQGALRSTHLTGTTTDLGLGLVRAFSPDDDAVRHRREVRANWARLGTILFFTAGAASGAFVYPRLGYAGFYLPGGLLLMDTLWVFGQKFRD